MRDKPLILGDQQGAGGAIAALLAVGFVLVLDVRFVCREVAAASAGQRVILAVFSLIVTGVTLPFFATLWRTAWMRVSATGDRYSIFRSVRAVDAGPIADLALIELTRSDSPGLFNRNGVSWSVMVKTPRGEFTVLRAGDGGRAERIAARLSGLASRHGLSIPVSIRDARRSAAG